MFVHLIYRFRRPAAGLFLGLLLLANSAQAVDWYVSPSGTDAIGNGTISNPYQTIRFGVAHMTNAVNPTVAATDILHIAAGYYTEPNICVNSNGVLMGAGPGQTIVQATDTWSLAVGTLPLTNRVFTIPSKAGAAPNVTLANMTIRYGFTKDCGGGIGQNVADVRANWTLTVTNCVICSNFQYLAASGYYGSGIGYGNNSGYGANSTIKLINSSILYNIGSANTGASAPRGGGVAILASNVVVSGCTIAYNVISNVYQSGAYSAGLGIYGGVTALVQNCTIATNGWVDGNGYTPCAVGGLSFGSGFASNGPPNTAGICIQGCTIVDNVGSNYGGLFINNSVTYPQVLIESCIIANNHIARPSGTFSAPDVAATSATGAYVKPLERYNVIGNCASNVGGSAIYYWTVCATSVVNNVTSVVKNANNSWVGSNGFVIAHNLGPLQNNGGPTMTMVPLTSSKAIDSGVNNTYNGNVMTFDQRGAPYQRTYGTATDVGAAEYGAGLTNLTYNSYGWQDTTAASGIINYYATNTTPASPLIIWITNCAPVTFAGSDNTEWSNSGNNLSVNGNSALTTANIPTDLTLHAAPTNSGMGLVLWFTGTITDSVLKTSPVNNVSFTFQDRAFANTNSGSAAAQIGNYAVNTLALALRQQSLLAASLSYSGTNFYENLDYNDGRIATTNTVTIIGVSEQWVNTTVGYDLLANGYATTNLVIPGLTAQLKVTDNTHANFILSGQATAHAAANSINGSGGLILTILGTAMSSGLTPANNVATNSITFYDAATLVTLHYGGTTFSENAANNGTFLGSSITVTLTSNLFVSGVTNYVSFVGLPNYLTGTVTYVSATNVTLTLTGSASSHNSVNNGPFTVQFATGAFYDLADGVPAVNATNTLNLSFLNPTLTWSGSFTELMPDNNGAIDPATFVTGTLVGDTFASASPSFTVNNPISGLTMNAVTTSPTIVKITLTGNAAAHAAGNSVNTLGLTFADAAFTQGSAGNVTGYNPANWTVTFFSPPTTWYVSQTGSDSGGNGTSGSPYATITKTISAATNWDIIHVLPGVINESIGNGAGGTGSGQGILVSKPLLFEGEDTLAQHGVSIVQAANTMSAATNRVFNLYNNAACTYALFRNLTIRNGNDLSSGTSGGGAIYALYPYTLIVSNCQISSCQSTNGQGGAIYATPAGSAAQKVYIYNSIFIGNTSARQGGALALIGTSSAGPQSVWLYDSAIIANQTPTNLISSPIPGGWGSVPGILITANTTALVQNCTICCNTGMSSYVGSLGGGAVYLSANNAPQGMTVRNCTIASNSSPYGPVGGLSFFNPSSTYLYSTIIAMNTSSNGGAPDIKNILGNQFLAAESNNLIGNCTNSGANSVTFTCISNGLPNVNGSYVGNSGTALGIVNPLLSALANNGGPTPTMALQVGSLAIDHGSNPGNIPNDQRGYGYNRVVGSQADIGAFEFGAGPPTGLVILIF